MAMTIDHISNGRVEVGLGAGWYVPEHRMYGIDFPSPPELVGRFREAVEIVDELLRYETTTYEGTYYQLAEARFLPRPIQQPRPPLTLGAHGPRMMRVVAQYADAWNSFGTVDEMRERNRILDEQCAAVGRNPNEIWRGLYGWAALMPSDPWESLDAFADMVGQYREAGVNEFIIDQPGTEQLAMAERVATDLLPKLRADASA
jgi:alkanesulfonate monooxygenase SsuD/methylene tetrahydromethanopterin reductase-like flavin-dependent oxidoreductase (luciferase family)